MVSDPNSTTVQSVELNDENVSLAKMVADAVSAERQRIIDLLRTEADSIAIEENAACWRTVARFLEADGSWYRFDELEAEVRRNERCWNTTR